MKYDVFISHASEDKDDVARPLAVHLDNLGLKVWLDEFESTVGDSLRRSIDNGLSQSRFGAVVLSPAFFTKKWPNRELDGLVSREDGREKVILPVWHNVSQDDVEKHSPILASKLAVSTSRGIEHVASQLFRAITRADATNDDPAGGLGPSESELLEEISQKMILAESSWELRRALYQLEEYLAKYPHSPEARLLHDKLEAASRRVAAMEARRAYAPRNVWRCEQRFASSGGIVGILFVAILIYYVYRLIKRLF